MLGMRERWSRGEGFSSLVTPTYRMARATTHDAVRIRQDRRLVQQLLSGDEEAFEHFAQEHFPGLFRFASSRLGWDEDLAQEIVQSTLCTAIDRLDGFRGESTLLTWLCGICNFEILGHFRRQRRRGQEVELDAEGPGAPADIDVLVPGGPLGNLASKEVQGLVFLALDQLPEHYGQILEWKYLEGIPVKEIAQRLALGPKAAESLLTRARAAFRQGFENLSQGHSDGGFRGLRFSTEEGSR